MATIDERMEKAVESVKREWARIRTGIATPALLDEVSLDYFGTMTPISHLSSISSPEPRTLQIDPWDKTQLSAIERAIHGANLGVSPINDGKCIRIVFPPLTEERRKDLAKQVRKIAEDGKIAVRNIRRDENDHYKKESKKEDVSEDEVKKGLENIQKITDSFIVKIDELCHSKEQDVLQV